MTRWLLGCSSWSGHCYSVVAGCQGITMHIAKEFGCCQSKIWEVVRVFVGGC